VDGDVNRCHVRKTVSILVTAAVVSASLLGMVCVGRSARRGINEAERPSGSEAKKTLTSEPEKKRKGKFIQKYYDNSEKTRNNGPTISRQDFPNT
jgi:hypothetical protein